MCFTLLCTREVTLPDERYFEAGFEAGFSSTERFFARLPDDVRDLRGKSVLDLGCGNGSTEKFDLVLSKNTWEPDP
jgi:2-polyprenyl-3-methyl-5-hydroxy-6-metoxy-1,4-benzoquinol methylase